MVTDEISQSPRAAVDNRQGNKAGAKAKVAPDMRSQKSPDSLVGMELLGLADS